MQDYILRHTSPPPAQLDALERDVHLRLLYPRMCSGRYQGRLLRMLTAMISPRRVLEIGTFAAYSTLCIAEALDDGARIDTVEIDSEMEPFIRRQLMHSPHGHKVNLHMGDIADVAPALTCTAPYDMAFIDGNKRTYLSTFRAILPLMRAGAFILADNTLWDNKVLSPGDHPDPQTAGIIQFNDAIAADTSLQAVMLPVRDGLTLIQLTPAAHL